jgi:hypothetical protein
MDERSGYFPSARWLILYKSSDFMADGEKKHLPQVHNNRPFKSNFNQGSWIPYRRKEPLPSPGGSPLHGGAAEEEVGDGDDLLPSADGVVVRGGIRHKSRAGAGATGLPRHRAKGRSLANCQPRLRAARPT